MYRGVPVDFDNYFGQKKCYGCNVSTVVFKLSQCNTCNIEYCYDCWNGFKRTCECSTANSKGDIRANECNRAICQRCKDRDSITCCNKRKYCKSRYFGYCDDCFGDRILYLSKQKLLPVSRGYLMYIINGYITDLKKIGGALEDKIKLLEDVCLEFKQPTELANLYRFSNEKADDPTLDKTSQYIWSGYVQDNNMPINDLYVKEIVLRKYVTLYGITDIDGKGLSIMYNKQLYLRNQLNYKVCADMFYSS